jgi:serpin B
MIMRALAVTLTGLGLTFCWLPWALGEGPPGRGGRAPRRPLTPDEQALVRANSEFAFDLLSKLPADGGNTFFSPFSVSTALAMTSAGARGETADQIASALHVRDLGQRVHAACASLLRRVDEETRQGRDELAVANALWSQTGLQVLPSFVTTLQQDYGAAIQMVNFAEAEPARQIVNGWVSKATRGMIEEVIPKGGLPSQTALLLTDVIYFKGRWQAPFPAERTRPGEFHPPSGKSYLVPFMHGDAKFRYFEDDLAQVLEIPYADGVLVMDVLLPRRADGLAEFERRLSSEAVASLFAQLRPRKVEVSLPKIHFAHSVELRGALSELGMSRVFGDAADFSGIVSGGHGLALSAMIHKACVDVNEEGTRAAAVTAPTFTATAITQAGPAVFVADHPFLLMIRDKDNGCLYFVGRINKP